MPIQEDYVAWINVYKYTLGALECLPVGVESGNENQREQIRTYIKKK